MPILEFWGKSTKGEKNPQPNVTDFISFLVCIHLFVFLFACCCIEDHWLVCLGVFVTGFKITEKV